MRGKVIFLSSLYASFYRFIHCFQKSAVVLFRKREKSKTGSKKLPKICFTLFGLSEISDKLQETNDPPCVRRPFPNVGELGGTGASGTVICKVEVAVAVQRERQVKVSA